MFDDVAERYDLTNDVLSLGQDRLWRRRWPGRSTPGPASACSTSLPAPGTRRCRSRAAGARRGRLRLLARHAAGRQAAHRPTCPSSAGDALRLPFADDCFDAVTISFGLRNVSDTDAALAEMARVTKPGGRLVVCEFSHPTWRPFRTVYSRVPDAGLPPVARAGRRATRMPTSTSPSRSGPGRTSRRSPGGSARAGWADVAWRNLTGGIVALHRRTSLATRGASSPAPKFLVHSRFGRPVIG